MASQWDAPDPNARILNRDGVPAESELVEEVFRAQPHLRGASDTDSLAELRRQVALLSEDYRTRAAIRAAEQAEAARKLAAEQEAIARAQAEERARVARERSAERARRAQELIDERARLDREQAEKREARIAAMHPLHRWTVRHPKFIRMIGVGGVALFGIGAVFLIALLGSSDQPARVCDVGGACSVGDVGPGGIALLGSSDQPARVCDVGGACSVGDVGPGGGVVFYDAGTDQSWGRYLEAAPEGWSGGADVSVNWCESDQPGYESDVPTGDGIGSGRENTTAIVEVCGAKSAAGVAAAYRGGGKSDWFLPSKDELNELYKQRSVVGGLASDSFWSSSQNGDSFLGAWLQFFNDGLQSFYIKDYDGRVRPVRAF